jgi:hypothetical protein
MLANAAIQLSVGLGSRLRGNDKTAKQNASERSSQNGPEAEGLAIRHYGAVFSKEEIISVHSYFS